MDVFNAITSLYQAGMLQGNTKLPGAATPSSSLLTYFAEPSDAPRDDCKLSQVKDALAGTKWEESLVEAIGRRPQEL